MKAVNNLQVIKKTIDDLPHAFDFPYWSIADTTFKDELFLSLLKALDVKKDEALKIQSKIFPKNKILRKILKEEVVLCMGVYGKYNGVAFFGTEKKFY